MDERNIARLYRIEFGCEMAGGKPVHHNRCRCPIVDIIRDRDQRRRADRNPLNIAAGSIYPGDALAGGKLLDALAYSDNPPGALDAKNLGIWSLGQAIPCRTPMSMKLTPA